MCSHQERRYEAPETDFLGNLKPYVRECGAAPRPAWHMGPRRLLDFLLVYIEEGCGHFAVGEKSFDVVAGDLIWIPPDVVHEMEGYPPRMVCPYVHFDLMFRPEYGDWDFGIPSGMVDLSALKVLMHPPVNVPLLRDLCGLIDGYTNRRVGGLISAICTEKARGHSFGDLQASGLMLQVLAEILRGQIGLAVDAHAHIAALEESAATMEQCCGEALRIPDLAQAARLSDSRFRCLFGQYFGCSPRTYLRRARIRHARELMLNTNQSLTEIASRVGFETVHSFSRAFHSLEGMAPSEFRSCAPSLNENIAPSASRLRRCGAPRET